MDTMKVCLGCGTKLAPDAPQGLCPQCLLKAGLETKVTPTAGMGHFVPPTPGELAQHFPQLEIVEVLGQGGMGVVYKARQPGLDRFVALKILSLDAGKDPSFAQRFALEARSLARLNHPNIIGVYDFGQAGGFYYFIMEFVDGTNLREMIKKLTPKEALTIVPKVCEALQFAHEEGIVHRDIKPENILIDKKGRVKMADFGLAKLLRKMPADHKLTAPQTVMGTPHYMAPEQLERPEEVDHRADIYSLGVVLYEMLTGELPLGRFAPPSAKAQIDVRLDEVVLRTLENKPERRYQHASDLKTELETITGMFDKLPPQLRTAFGFEYRSRATLFGLPLVHVTSGINVATGKRHVAKGIIAIGEVAKGFIAFGGLAIGVFSFGGASIGIVACGGFALGLCSFAGIAVALVMAFGGFSFAPIALGGFAFGYYAWGGAVFAVHAIGSNARDPLARDFFRDWPIMQMMIFNVLAAIFGICIGTFVPALIKRRIQRTNANQP
jgi:eukaryotic-like serine/threonine-protein kinase